MKTPINARVLFVKEIAETMRMSPVTVYKAIQRGELKAERYGTGKNSIRVSRARKEFGELAQVLKTLHSYPLTSPNACVSIWA